MEECGLVGLCNRYLTYFKKYENFLLICTSLGNKYPDFINPKLILQNQSHTGTHFPRCVISTQICPISMSKMAKKIKVGATKANL